MCEDEDADVERFPAIAVRFGQLFRSELVRLIMDSRMDGSSRISAAKFLVAVDQLPFTIPGLSLEASCEWRQHTGSGAIVSAEFFEDRLSLDVTEVIVGEYGGDSNTRNYLGVFASEEPEDDSDDLEDSVYRWLEAWKATSQDTDARIWLSDPDDESETEWDAPKPRS